MVDEGVAGNAGFGLVGFGESAVDNHHFAVGFDGLLALQRPHWHVTVDDVAVLTFHSKLVEDVVAHFFVVAQNLVVAFHFFAGLLIIDEIVFEGSHFVLVEHGRVGAAP